MSTNLLVQFRRLMPGSPLLVCAVISSGSGGSIVELPGGARIAVRGEATVGTQVFVRNGAIEGPAPNLTQVFVEV